MSDTESNPTPNQETPVVPAGPPESELRFVEDFPEGKSIADMSDAEKANYWQHYARKNAQEAERAKKMVEDRFHGLNADQIKALADENESLKAEKMTASEKAVAAAQKDAEKSAEAAAAAKYLPQIQALQVKSIASQVISGDKLNAFMQVVNPAALVGKDGQVDEAQIMGVLTAMYGTDPQPSTGQRHQNFGQYSPPPPRGAPGQNGTAEAQKRFGAKT